MSESSVKATVVYADVSGFTAISERLDPEQVTAIMNRCFETLEDVVLQHGGTVHEYLGDCVLAVFEDFNGAATDARRGVEAGAAMMAALRDLSGKADIPADLNLHVGIEAGSLVAGRVGDQEADTCLAGLPLRVAGRLEDASTAGAILVGPTVHDATTEWFEYRATEPVAAGAGGALVDVHEYIDRRPGTEPWRAAPAGASSAAVTGGAEAVTGRAEAAAGGAEAATGGAEAAAGGPRRGRRVGRASERRQVTVMFAELSGFWHLAQTLPADRTIALLSHYYGIVDPIVTACGGFVDKHIGASVMALFGAPNAIENAPQQAVNCAIAMKTSIAEWNATGELPEPLALRAGINTGLVIAGELGGRIRRDFTVIGDAANVAARLCAKAPAAAIYAGTSTYRATGNAFEFRATEPLTLQGKAEAVPAYEVTSEQQQAYRTRAGSDGRVLSSQMVGRETELAELRERLDHLVEGRGGIVCIQGEAGLGKTRLASELLAGAEGADVRVLIGRCTSTGTNASFHPIIDLLRSWCGIEDADGEATAVERLAAALGGLPLEDTSETQAYVATLMGLPTTAEFAQRLEAMDGDVRERLIFKHMRDLFAALAGPARASDGEDLMPALLMVFEDLHWTDESSARLLTSLLRLTEQAPLLFLFVLRPDESAIAGSLIESGRTSSPERWTQILLQPLAEQYAVRLVESLLDIEDLPAATRRLILDKAEGNPFFLEEVVRTLIEQDAVRFVDGRYRITEKIDNVEIPGTIQEVILARVDRLDERTRNAIQLASVVGRAFSYETLREVMRDAGRVDEALAECLELLVEKQILLRYGGNWEIPVEARSTADELEYIFKHAVAQQAIYEALLQHTRRELHADVARTVESMSGDRVGEFAGMLAYHFLQAEDLDKAEIYLFRAGEEAARSAASSEALKLFEQAAQIFLERNPDGGDPTKRMQLERNIALAHWNKGNLAQSIEHFNDTLGFLGESVPRNPVALYGRFARDLLSVLIRLYVLGPSKRRPRDLAHEKLVLEVVYARSRAQATADDAMRLFLDNINAIRRCSVVDSTLLEQSCGIYATSSGLFSFAALSFDVARRFLDRAEDCKRPGNVSDQVFCGTFRTVYSLLSGDWRDETAMDESLVDAGIRAGELWDVNTYLGLECDRLFRLGKFTEARHQLDRLAELRDTYGYEFAGSNYDGMLTMLSLEQGRLDEALEAVERYDATRQESSLRVLAKGMKAKAQILCGDLEGAAATLERSSEIAKGSGTIAPWHAGFDALARVRLDIARVDAGGTLPRATRGRRRRALRIAKVVAEHRTEAARLVGTLEWLQDRPQQAVGWWTQSVEAAEQLGARPELARCWAEVAHRAGGHGDARVNGLAPQECRARAEALFAELGLDQDAVLLVNTL